MSILNPTAERLLVDEAGRPYFLWDENTSMEEFIRSLKDPDPEVRAYRVGKLMRQAKPDDVFAFTSLQEIADLWPWVERYLGRSRPFWVWLLESWRVIPGDGE